MEKLNILLCCGAGMSSGLLAQQMRGIAKKQGIMARVEAKSRNNIADDFPETDIPPIGPHLSCAFDELKAMCGLYAVPAPIIPKDIYVRLDGEGLPALYTEMLEEKGQSYEYTY